MKYFIYVLFASLISLVCHCADQYRELDGLKIQLDTFHEIAERHRNNSTACIPDLIHQIHANITKVRAILISQSDLLNDFDKCMVAVQASWGRGGPRFFQYSLCHYMLACYIDKFFQGPEDTENERAFVVLRTIFDKQIETSFELDKLRHFEPYNQEFTPEGVVVSRLVTLAIHIENGIFPFFFLSKNGLLPYYLLNKCYANRMPNNGIPCCKRSNFDGEASTTRLFLEHEMEHLMFKIHYKSEPNSLAAIFPQVDIDKLSKGYDYYAQIFYSLKKDDLAGHFGLYYVGHEMSFKNDYVTFISSLQEVNILLDQTKIYLMDIVQDCQLHMRDFRYRFMPNTQDEKPPFPTVVQYIIEHKLPRSKQLFQEDVDPEQKDIRHQFFTGYNIMIEAFRVLKQLEYPINLWESDQLNEVGMLNGIVDMISRAKTSFEQVLSTSLKAEPESINNN